MEIITGSDLAFYPGVGGTDSESFDSLAAAVSALVSEAWAAPVDPAPEWVRTIAINAALRLHWNPKGLESWTRSWDDFSRTERAAAGDGSSGLSLTAEERRQLGGATGRRRVGSIRLRVPGFS